MVLTSLSAACLLPLLVASFAGYFLALLTLLVPAPHYASVSTTGSSCKTKGTQRNIYLYCFCGLDQLVRFPPFYCLPLFPLAQVVKRLGNRV